MNRPPKGHTWVHIDALDKPNGRHWAVQTWRGGRCRWLTAKSVGWQGRFAEIETVSLRDGQPCHMIEVRGPHEVRTTPNGGVVVEGVA